MRLFKPLLISASVVFLVVGVLLGSGLVSRFISPATGITNAPAIAPILSSQLARTTQGLPVRLKIPSIKVDAPLDYVGLTASGELDVPTLPSNAAWYAQGPRPGQAGNAVIDGHYGWAGNKPAVFDNLSKVHQGDGIYVKDDHGVTTSFVVTRIRTLGQDQDAQEAFVSSDTKSHLVLITCKGSWDKTDRSYSDRLVVFADKLE